MMPSNYHQTPRYQAFPSHRSTIHSTQGIIACTQPLAAQAGQRILAAGGNAADAAVAIAAALNMPEPTSTGIGGDMFCLYYDTKSKKVHSQNGSGRSTEELSLTGLREELGLKDGEHGEIPMRSAYSVTVPGAAAGWVDTLEKFGSGKVNMEQVLKPAIELGEEGFPVSEIAAYYVCPNHIPLLKEGSGPSRQFAENPAVGQSIRPPQRCLSQRW